MTETSLLLSHYTHHTATAIGPSRAGELNAGNKYDKDRSWHDIATAMDIPVEEVRARATSLRTQYSKLLKSKPSGSGDTALTSKQKWMLKSLFFLKAHVVQRATETSLHMSVKDSLAVEEIHSEAEEETFGILRCV
ncbi:unnamed protein product [Gadus morhua 'NCC']